MSGFFKPNIDRRGRIARGVIGLVCLMGGAIVAAKALWPGLALAAAGVFAIFEALRGWCLARACGVKTKL